MDEQKSVPASRIRSVGLRRRGSSGSEGAIESIQGPLGRAGFPNAKGPRVQAKDAAVKTASERDTPRQSVITEYQPLCA